MREPAGTSKSVVGVIQAIRTYLRRRAEVTIALAAVAVAGGVLVLAWWLAGADGWRPGTAVPLLLLVLGALIVGGFLARVVVRLRKWSAEGALAAQIERTVRLPEGSVRAHAELARSVPEGVSPALAKAGEGALLKRLTQGVGQLSGGPGEELARLTRMSAVAAVVACVALVALLVLTPARARTAWAGLTRPVALLTPEPLPPLQLFPGDVQLPRGERPLVEVGAEGRDSVTVHWQAIGDVLREQALGVVEARAELLLPELEVDVRYWASSPDGAVTTIRTLVPSDPSLLADLTLEVIYPAHTRLPTESFRGVPAWLRIPQGTEIRLAGRMDGRGEEILLLGEGDRVAARLAVESGRFSGRWRPTRSELITWAVNGGQEGAILPQPLELEVIADAPPELALPVPGEDGQLSLSMRLPILLEASDDFGVAWVEVETTHQRPGAEDVVVVDQIPTGDLPQITLRPVLDFSSWGLRPGDAILLTARATDNSPFEQTAQTATYRLSMPVESEVRDVARTRIDEATNRARELLERVSRETASLRDLERQNRLGSQQSGGNGNEPDAFEDREELRQAIESQAELASQLDQLMTELEQTSRALAEMAERSEEDAALRERIEELEQFLDDALDPEARDRLEELREQLRQGELPEAPEELLAELAERQEELQARLEEALEQLRRSALEEAFRGAEEDVRELLETQEALVDELARGEGEEAQREQAQRTEAVEERLSSLEEELSASGDSDATQQTESARNELSEAREAMNRAAEASQSEEREEAAAEAASAQESLQSALEQLEETSSGLSEDPEEQMQEALRRGAQDALALARRQERVRSELNGGFSVDRQQLEGEQVAIREGLRNLAEELSEQAQATPEGSEAVSDAVESAQAAVEEAVAGLRSGGSRSDVETLADEAQAAMNQIALAALGALGQGSGEQQGDPSTEQMTEELASIGAQQASLNEDANQLTDQSSPGGAPAQMELQNLVSGQRGVAARLQELARRPGPGGTRSSLDALADESRDIAEELRNGRLDATTLGRQEQLLERLLQAGRTLERDGPTEEREATSAEAFERRAVTALPTDLLDPLALPLPSSADLGALSPAQRRLVLDYFERVNRRRAGEDGR